MMGLHVIIHTHAPDIRQDKRTRLRGVFTDEQFEALPLVKQFGAFPSGYHAGHFGSLDDAAGRSYMAIPESDLDARAVLADLLKRAQRGTYTLNLGPHVLGRYSSKTRAIQAFRRFTGFWRSWDAATGQYAKRGQFRATRLDRPWVEGHEDELPRAKLTSRYGQQYHGHLTVEPAIHTSGLTAAINGSTDLGELRDPRTVAIAQRVQREVQPAS